MTGVDIGIETGLGLASYRSQFHFEYFHSFSQQWIDTQFNIGLNYLSAPLKLYYNRMVSNKSSIIISSGIHLKFLLWAEDNFDKIVFEKIGLPSVYSRYQSLVSTYYASIAYQYMSGNKNIFELSINVENDLNAIGKNDPIFGFYANLRNATNSQFGISFKYCFAP